MSTCLYFFFFFNDTATTEIYTLSLHDALPIWPRHRRADPLATWQAPCLPVPRRPRQAQAAGHTSSACRDRSRTHRRSEEHTSELQSRQYLVCRLLLEKKKTKPSRT